MDAAFNSYDLWPDAPKNGVDIIDKLNHVYTSKSQGITIKLATLKWSLQFDPQTKDDSYRVTLECENRSSLWKCDVELEATFRDGLESEIVKVEQQCSLVHNKMYLESKDMQYVTTLSVDVRIIVKNVKGIRKFQRFNPLEEEPALADVILVIEGKKLKANKAYLAHASKFFKCLFFGNFSEQNEQEIELKDVVFDEFVDLMNVISPERKKITDDNVEFILKLADRFDMQTVINQCETFLVYFSHLIYVRKLFLADKYLLVDLQDDCMNQASKETIKRIRRSNMYPQLSDSTKATLFEETCKLFVNDIVLSGRDDADDC